jgi:hypothetical protein
MSVLRAFIAAANAALALPASVTDAIPRAQ